MESLWRCTFPYQRIHERTYRNQYQPDYPSLMSKHINAVTPKGFVIKLILFVMAFQPDNFIEKLETQVI
ncbi:hypothetical protein ED312_23190 [Sinomicrobium pectinilyticum]|uniref:Uncharacterized protein n=1 Tax=Sinomicrobium pectinilyticum TaxID=1084421 RepID=A0A3N0CYV2_SINP1|nr:hypothetical protein ED312_23190 [Sinomicrobium pectinilyticum]